MIVGDDFRDEMSEFEALPNSVGEGSPEFMKAYWDWWDNNAEIRIKFANYPADMSHIFFFNTVWRKRDVGSKE